MTNSLAASLAVVLPHLPDTLVAPPARAAVHRLATRMAPVVRCGFEVRLADPSGENVDFQQGVFAREGEREALERHLASGGDQRLADLVARWRGGTSPLGRALEELWLEFDRPPSAALSVFAGFTRSALSASERAGAIAEALDLLAGPETWQFWRAGVERITRACPRDALVSHVGVMLGRPAPFVRLNVKRLTPDELPTYLRDVGWPGPQSEASDLMRELRELGDGVTVCFDVRERVGERIGFEWSLKRQPVDEPRWAALFDELVGRGWCTSDKRDALLTWPGLSLPSVEGPPWPPDLLAAGLLRPPDRFTALDRQLSHVKVTIGGARPPEAKGYFGFLHTWLSPAGEPAEAPPPRQRRRGYVRANARSATEAAVAFLLDSRTRAGWWRDFHGAGEWTLAFGASDAWVSAYVATALAPTLDARHAAERVWSMLVERQLPCGGWSYSRGAPGDADSTAWGLSLAAALGQAAGSAAARAREFLGRHRLAGGALTTYLEETCPSPVTPSLTPPDGSRAGWTQTGHACVSAAAAAVTHGGAILEWLRRAQTQDGSWAGYWWCDREYATALAAEALADGNRGADRSRVHAAVEWASRDVTGSSPFALALRVRILRFDDRGARHLSRAVATLLTQQDADGGWPASARLRAPRPDVRDPERVSSGVDTVDGARTFTTATVLTALTAAGE